MEYSPTDYTNLCAITTYYKSNKGKDVNNYSPLYNNILEAYRQHEIRILEFDTSVETENVKGMQFLIVFKQKVYTTVDNKFYIETYKINTVYKKLLNISKL